MLDKLVATSVGYAYPLTLASRVVDLFRNRAPDEAICQDYRLTRLTPNTENSTDG